MNRKTSVQCGLGAATALFLAACAPQQAAFDLADADDDQKVSLQEFERYMLEAVFAEADADGNAKVTFEEWKAANPDADPEKFRAPDKDGDRMVSPEEAEAFFAKQGTWADLFDKIDTDNDGYVTSAEAVAFRDRMAALSGTTLQQLQQAADQK